MVGNWSDLKIGTPVTGFNTSHTSYVDNLQVVSVGHDWAVLRNVTTGRIVSYVLEPTDSFRIGFHEYDETDGSLNIITPKECIVLNSTI